MHRSRRLAAPLLAGAALAVVAAFTPVRAAEIAQGQWEVGGDLVSTTYDNDTTMEDTFSFAVRAGWALRTKHMFEFHVNMQSADSELEGVDESFSIDRYTVNYVGNIKSKKPDSKLAGYALFGVGVILIDGEGGSDKSTLFRGGGGTRYFFTKSFALRVEGTLAQFHGDGNAIPRRGYFDFDLAVGVSFLLGGS